MKLKSISGTKQPEIYFTPTAFDFLMAITKPADLKHDAPLADFIRNNVLTEIRNKIKYEQTRMFNKKSN
jgi:hypothetical protein